MTYTERLEIKGDGSVVKVAIKGKPDRNCYACHCVINGAAIGCTQHNVTREERGGGQR